MLTRESSMDTGLAKKIFTNVGILFGTVLLLVVSIAWVDFIAEIRQKFAVFKNPLVSQAIFMFSITAVSLAFLIYFNPFSTEKSVGIERLVEEERVIRPFI